MIVSMSIFLLDNGIQNKMFNGLCFALNPLQYLFAYYSRVYHCNIYDSIVHVDNTVVISQKLPVFL